MLWVYASVTKIWPKHYVYIFAWFSWFGCSKSANPGLFFIYFRLFKHTLQFLQQINLKKCPSSKQYRDPNSQPLEGLPPLVDLFDPYYYLSFEFVIGLWNRKLKNKGYLAEVGRNFESYSRVEPDRIFTSAYNKAGLELMTFVHKASSQCSCQWQLSWVLCRIEPGTSWLKCKSKTIVLSSEVWIKKCVNLICRKTLKAF